jgi:hypothetical protein
MIAITAIERKSFLDAIPDFPNARKFYHEQQLDCPKTTIQANLGMESIHHSEKQYTIQIAAGCHSVAWHRHYQPALSWLRDCRRKSDVALSENLRQRKTILARSGRIRGGTREFSERML